MLVDASRLKLHTKSRFCRGMSLLGKQLAVRTKPRSPGIAKRISQPGGHVELRAERDVLAIVSNCPQMHNPCNGSNPTLMQV
jgi:hypothetical protein